MNMLFKPGDPPLNARRDRSDNKVVLFLKITTIIIKKNLAYDGIKIVLLVLANFSKA